MKIHPENEIGSLTEFASNTRAQGAELKITNQPRVQLASEREMDIRLAAALDDSANGTCGTDAEPVF